MTDGTPTPSDTTSFEARLYEAIKVQRPAVIAHIRTVRRARPDATPEEAIKILESGYLAAVTTASAAVGGSAAIPAIGTTVALGLSAADLLLFFELSALYSLSIAEVHGLTVSDPERAKVLVIGMVVGSDGARRVGQIVADAVAEGVADGGVAGVAGDVARATSAARSGQWGDVVATAVPEGQLNPIVKQILTAGAAKLGAKAGGGTIAKILPFGIGAVVGGAASFMFGRSVVEASRSAFSAPPAVWPAWLDLPDEDGDGVPDPPRSLVLMQETLGNAKDFSEDVWSKLGDTALVAGAGVSAATEAATRVFRSVDRDGDGIPDEAQALTAVKGAAGAVAGAAGALTGRLAGAFRRGKGRGGDTADVDGAQDTSSDDPAEASDARPDPAP